MRWTPETAEALLRLRAILLSGDLNDYWQFHLTRDQQRPLPRLAVVLK